MIRLVYVSQVQFLGSSSSKSTSEGTLIDLNASNGSINRQSSTEEIITVDNEEPDQGEVILLKGDLYVNEYRLLFNIDIELLYQ